MSDKQTSKQAQDEAAVLTRIAEWPEPYASISERLHARLWYALRSRHPQGSMTS
jgi:hypothetical protein